VGFLKVGVNDTRVIEFWYTRECADGLDQPRWRFEHPGSYAEGHEHERVEELPVEGVTFHLRRVYGLPWQVEEVQVRCARGTGRRREIIVATVKSGKYNAVPWWLVKLAANAVQEP